MQGKRDLHKKTSFALEYAPLAGEPLAVRRCSIVEPPVYFRWEDHETRSCGEERSDVTLEEVKTVSYK